MIYSPSSHPRCICIYEVLSDEYNQSYIKNVGSSKLYNVYKVLFSLRMVVEILKQNKVNSSIIKSAPHDSRGLIKALWS